MKNKSVPFSIRMPRELKKAVAKQARKEGCHSSKVACNALKEFLKINGHKKHDRRK